VKVKRREDSININPESLDAVPTLHDDMRSAISRLNSAMKVRLEPPKQAGKERKKKSEK